MFKAPLQHTTAVWVCRKLIYVATERIDKFQAIGRNPLYQLLNDLQVKQERNEDELKSGQLEVKNSRGCRLHP